MINLQSMPTKKNDFATMLNSYNHNISSITTLMEYLFTNVRTEKNKKLFQHNE